MRLLIAALVIFGGYKSNAATNETFFITGSGSKIDAQAAILKSAGGEVVYKCSPQEFKVSKSGTSIGVKNKKKKLTREEIVQQIEELKKRGE